MKRKIPFLVTKCDSCGKEIELWEEEDFYARKTEKGFDFFYVCPECGAASKQPECWLPTYLKNQLIEDELRREDLVDAILLTMLTIVVIILLVWFFIVR